MRNAATFALTNSILFYKKIKTKKFFVSLGGISPQILQQLGIEGPLSNIVFVSNVSRFFLFLRKATKYSYINCLRYSYGS